jgi:hypothetical protein
MKGPSPLLVAALGGAIFGTLVAAKFGWLFVILGCLAYLATVVVINVIGQKSRARDE